MVLTCFAFYSHAEELTIDRTGYHTGLGGNLVVANDDSEALPVFNLSLEYGLTSQSTVVLEHHGFLIAGFTVLEYKYYAANSRDTFYGMGGVGVGHVLDDDAGDILSKIGLGYAWNHLESEFFVVADDDLLFSALSLRYKF